jgi:hypothetical protein
MDAEQIQKVNVFLKVIRPTCVSMENLRDEMQNDDSDSDDTETMETACDSMADVITHLESLLPPPKES